MDTLTEWDVLMLDPETGTEVSMTVLGRTAEIARTEARSMCDALILELTPLEH